MASLKILVIFALLAAVNAEYFTRVKQYFHEDCENAFNRQITREFRASYIYQSISTYFARDSVALHGFSEFFKKASAEERDHALKMIDYMIKRGGEVRFDDILKPHTMDWGTPLDAVAVALEIEKEYQDEIMKLHRVADKTGDPHMMDFLESEFLGEQIDAIKTLSEVYSKLKRAGTGVGEHIIDKEVADMSF